MHSRHAMKSILHHYTDQNPRTTMLVLQVSIGIKWQRMNLMSDELFLGQLKELNQQYIRFLSPLIFTCYMVGHN